MDHYQGQEVLHGLNKRDHRRGLSAQSLRREVPLKDGKSAAVEILYLGGWHLLPKSCRNSGPLSLMATAQDITLTTQQHQLLEEALQHFDDDAKSRGAALMRMAR